MRKGKENKKRITLYDTVILPRWDEIKQWVKEGLTDEEIASRLDMTSWTLREYRKQYPQFAKMMERPTKWETVILPNLSDIQKWIEAGVTIDQICERIGIAPSSWFEYVNKHPVLKNLIDWSRSVTNSRVENSLLKAAMGYEYEEIKTIVEEDKNGKKRTRIEKVKRHMPPNPTAIVFWLKNRSPDEWNDRRELVVDTKALEQERKKLFLEMIEADVLDAEYEAIEESCHTEEGFEEPEDETP
ncbi:transposase [Brevibacillus composti]|uniref:Transposase n=1 Tax=Brevibacillus composti TaxID=2796470 RepID=A0A7T5ELV3_9BACL|nr:transposase [Brevibacillus composti]QQE74989.1 transposase [Brevibacillus composti]QUO42074.1 transposase [Brevibacillus composti]